MTTKPRTFSHPVTGDRLSDSIIEQAAVFGTATLHEAAGKTGALPSGIKPIGPSHRLCGPAVTVHSPPADNLWLHRAIYEASPGDVLVVTVSDHYEAGYWGEIMSCAAEARKLGGLVIDGCVRDGAVLGAGTFPVFARGLCIQGTGKDFGATGFINAPVFIGGVTVHAGDLVSGDADGVVVIARSDVEQVMAASARREADEQEFMTRLRSGATTLQIYGWE